MPSDILPTHIKLLGENESIWAILALLLVGVITSITTMELLLPPDMSQESVTTGANSFEHRVQTPQPPIAPAIQSDHPIASPQANKIEQPAAAPAEFAANEAPAKADTRVAAAKVVKVAKPDCAPLFSVPFLREETQPIDTDLTEQAHKLSDWLKLHPQAELLVEGHTDASGPEAYNLFISHQRAKAVYELLAHYGLSEARMAVRALGEDAPLAGLPPESAQNRRVSLRIEGVPACSSLPTEGNDR